MLDHGPSLAKATNSSPATRMMKGDWSSSNTVHRISTESDAESFYSATSDITRRRRQRERRKTAPGSRSSRARRHDEYMSTPLDDDHDDDDDDAPFSPSSPPGWDQLDSRSWSAASRKTISGHDQRFNVPIRRSSVGARRSSRRPDSVTLHRQSCQLFSSLDGILERSRPFTPLLSGGTASSSRAMTATRQNSIATGREENDECVSRLGEMVDAKLEVQMTTTPPLLPLSPSRHSLSDSVSSSRFSPRRQPSSISSLQDREPIHPRISIGSQTRFQDQHQRQHQRPPFHTVNISWTSDATRRAEYEKIDRAHSGLRGFLNRVLPQRWSRAHGARRNFFTGECDGDSVRRFRLDVPESESELEPESDPDEGTREEGLNEKGRNSRLNRRPPKTGATGWSCFAP